MKKFLVLFLFLFSITALAQKIPAPISYVNDYAHILSSQTVNSLNDSLKNFEVKTSNQIVVAIFPGKVEGSIEDFSVKLEEQWKIGQKNKDNGVLLVIFPDDRQLRIEVGYGLEGAIPDALANQIIQQEIIPNFKQQDYDQGVINGVNAIMQATKGEYQNNSTKNSNIGWWVIIFLIFLLIFLNNFTKGNSGRGGWGGGFPSGGSTGGGFSGGGGSSGGGGASGRW